MIDAHRFAWCGALLFLAGCGSPPWTVPGDTTALEQLRAEETRSLSAYDVVDAQAGLYQIPIDRAMDAVAADPRLLEPVIELPDLTKMTAVERGRYHFEYTYACSGCHALDGTRKQAPPLNQRWGSLSEMETGDPATFDDAYFTESVLNPRARQVKSYPPIMPVFADRMSKEDLEDLRAFLKST